MPLNIDLTSKQKMALMTAGIVLIGLFLGRTVIYKDNFQRARKIQAKIEEQKKINKLVAEIGKLETKVSLYKGMTAEVPDTNWLFNRLDELAKEAGVKIDSIDPAKPQIKGSFTFLICNLKVSAPYHKLGLFISKVESDKRRMMIESLEMVPIKKEGSRVVGAGGFAAPESGDMFERNDEGGIWMNATIQISSFYVS